MTIKTGTINWLVCGALLAASPVLYSQQDEDDSGRSEELRQELREARAELAEAARRMARLQRELSTEGIGTEEERLRTDENDDFKVLRKLREQHHIGDMPPRLGLLLGGPGPETSYEVMGLTPGGGAEAAGIAQGDRLISVNGKTLTGDTPDSIRDALSDVEAGTSVPVVVDRDGEQLTFDVKTSSVLPDFRFFGLRSAPEGGVHEREIVIMAPNGSDFRVDGLAPEPPFPPRHPRFSGLGRNSDMISNHPGLEPYFGTAEGVVVLRIDPENAFSLEDGDVVLSLDSEPVGRPVDLGRLLLSREPGDQAVLEIMRNGVLMQLDVTIPERNESLTGLHHIEIQRELGPPRAPKPPRQPF